MEDRRAHDRIEKLETVVQTHLIEHSRFEADLQKNTKLTQEIERLKRDALTGLENRHALPEKEEKRKESGKPWSILLLDIDRFKSINDIHGHDAGDKVLADIAKYLEGIFRKSDSVIRYGGEEFAVIIKNAAPQDVINKLFNKKDRRAEIGFETDFNGQKIRSTFSGGVTGFDREEEIKSAITRADQALYFSKERGRDQITIWNEKLQENEFKK